MASASSLSEALIAELRRSIADNGIGRPQSPDGYERFLSPARLPSELSRLVGKAPRERPLAIAVDVYGTLLASAIGEIGPSAEWGETDDAAEEAAREAFPSDMAERLRAIVEEDHARSRARGVPWPEVDAPSAFARALGLGLEDGARTCVAWECTINRCAPMPGAAEFLAVCAKKGVPLGIVSNAQFYTRLFIEEAFESDLYRGEADEADEADDARPEGASGRPCLGFDPELALWSYETGRAKPDRWMFDELARRLSARGIPADRILYIGNDALNDCAAAGEAGLMTALFAGDARSCRPRSGDDRVAAHPPSLVVYSWDDLRRLLCT